MKHKENFENEIIVRSILKRFNFKFLDYDDLFYEGILEALKARKDFNPNLNTKPSTYVYMRIKCHYLSLYRASKAQKRNVDKNTSIDFLAIEDTALFYDKALCSFPSQEIEIEERELKESLNKLLKEILSVEEFEIINFYLKGYTTKELAQMFSLDKRQMSNKLYYIKRKLRKKSYMFEKFKKIL